jgi:hypothetical protein
MMTYKNTFPAGEKQEAKTEEKTEGSELWRDRKSL